ncbi:unnamed protein product [Microthlaspi erraticum]|uniref:Uncharacterized protein n=2 Tax=Microthlaspi erraticum TaxID=1685480 RepID=A0A6D2IT42_9BRAS|nr:unnamed protein product [Microthlaspi erraticum]
MTELKNMMAQVLKGQLKHINAIEGMSDANEDSSRECMGDFSNEANEEDVNYIGNYGNKGYNRSYRPNPNMSYRNPNVENPHWIKSSKNTSYAYGSHDLQFANLLRHHLIQESSERFIAVKEAAGELVAEEEQLEPEEALEALALPTGPITRSQTKMLNQDIGRVLSRLSRHDQELKHSTLPFNPFPSIPFIDPFITSSSQSIPPSSLVPFIPSSSFNLYLLQSADPQQGVYQVVFWSILEHMGQGAWRDLAHGSSSTGYAKEEGRSHLEDQLDRLLDQPVEFLNSTGQASTRSSWKSKSNPKNVASPLTFL